MKIIVTAIVLSMVTATTALAGTKTYGNWHVVSEIDAMTGERDNRIYSYATTKDSQYSHTRPFMAVSCTSLYFGGLDIVSTGDFLYRTDTMSEATSFSGDEWQGSDGTSLDLPKRYRGYSYWKEAYTQSFKNSIAGSYAFVRFESYARSNQTIKVSLNGFTPAIKALAAACLK